MKRFVYIVLTISLPFLVIGLAEAVLRIFIPGNPPEMIRKIGDVDGKSFMLFDRVGPASFFGPQAHRMSPSEIVGFIMPKPTNTIRIILTGESAMRGFPQPAAFTAASILQEMLKDEYPDYQIEVLNFSATAIASFPVMKITEAALQCEPDIVVTMAGHNEFFGAYGAVVTRYIESNTRFFDLDYRLRHSAIGQLIGKLIAKSHRNQPGKQLMELMAGVDRIPEDDPMRERAAENFRRHMIRIAQACRNAGIPLVMCVPPSNETGLAPIGLDDHSGIQKGHSAQVSFQMAKEFQQAGQHDEAVKLFIDARDRDAMPWRASSRIQNLVRELTTEYGSVLCDLDQLFKAEGGNDGIGWNLMDDHVHPNIDGQALLAESIRNSIRPILENNHRRVHTQTSRRAYLNQLGDNVYDRFSVARTMYVLFQIPFLAESNPEAMQRFETQSRELAKQIPANLNVAIQLWNTQTTLSIGKRPLSGFAAMELLKLGKAKEALPLLATATRNVPPYSSWSLEYTYYYLAAKKSMHGTLDITDFNFAANALKRGEILMSVGETASGQTERFMGRILQVLEKHSEAVPYLQAARAKLQGIDRVANDRALIEALQVLGRQEEADAIIAEGQSGDPKLAPYYR